MRRTEDGGVIFTRNEVRQLKTAKLLLNKAAVHGCDDACELADHMQAFEDQLTHGSDDGYEWDGNTGPKPEKDVIEDEVQTS